MPAFKQLDVSELLNHGSISKSETLGSANPAKVAKVGRNPQDFCGSNFSNPLLMAAKVAPFGGDFRELDVKSIISGGQGASQDGSPVPPPAAFEPDYFDLEERAAIIQFDGQPSQPEPSPAPAFRDAPESRLAMVAPSSERTVADRSGRFGVPGKWVAGYQAMVSASPRSVSQGRWSDLITAVEVVLERWARQALALGWDELDLFGCHPRSPVKRLDHQGLAWFVDPDTEIIAITDTTTRFRKPGGAVQSIIRQPIKEPGGVPVWRLCK